MPALPWTTVREPEPDREYIVMASRLPLARYRHISPFLRATMAIRTQLASAEGLIGYTLDARLLRKTFWTLSVWESEEALQAFSHADPHRDRVGGIRAHMRPTVFRFWSAPGTAVPPRWADARQRIETVGS